MGLGLGLQTIPVSVRTGWLEWAGGASLQRIASGYFCVTLLQLPTQYPRLEALVRGEGSLSKVWGTKVHGHRAG